MASMIRKHLGSAFEPSRPLPAAYCLGSIAVTSRLLATSFASGGARWMALASLAWILAYGLFLAAFGRRLLSRS
jgi:uncharacterized protein involved in response to NO